MIEEKIKCELGLNALCNLLKPDGLFEHSTSSRQIPYNFLYHLQAISVLISGYQIFNVPYFLSKATEARTHTYKHLFKTTFGKSFFFEDNSLVVWNAMASLIEFKLSNNDIAIELVDSILDEISEKQTNYHFSKIQESRGISGSELGIILLSLILSYKTTNNKVYLDKANHIGNQLLKTRSIYSGYDVWGLVVLGDILDNKYFKERANKIATMMSQVKMTSMTSLYAGILQQMCVATGNPNDLLLKRQYEMQILPNHQTSFSDKYIGNFVRKNVTDIRIEYTIQNTLSMIQYIHNNLKDTKEFIIWC